MFFVKCCGVVFSWHDSPFFRGIQEREDPLSYLICLRLAYPLLRQFPFQFGPLLRLGVNTRKDQSLTGVERSASVVSQGLHSTGTQSEPRGSKHGTAKGYQRQRT